MRLSPAQRREKLQLFNVAEAARELGVNQKTLYADIWSERIIRPTTKIQRRTYFTAEEIEELKEHYMEVNKNEDQGG